MRSQPLITLRNLHCNLCLLFDAWPHFRSCTLQSYFLNHAILSTFESYSPYQTKLQYLRGILPKIQQYGTQLQPPGSILIIIKQSNGINLLVYPLYIYSVSLHFQKIQSILSQTVDSGDMPLDRFF